MYMEYAEDDQQPICWREEDEISCIAKKTATHQQDSIRLRPHSRSTCLKPLTSTNQALVMGLLSGGKKKRRDDES